MGTDKKVGDIMQIQLNICYNKFKFLRNIYYTELYSFIFFLGLKILSHEQFRNMWIRGRSHRILLCELKFPLVNQLFSLLNLMRMIVFL